MTAYDLGPVLHDVSALAGRAAGVAMQTPDFPGHEAGAILEALTGVRMDWQRARGLGPERAGAVHLAKSISVLSSMLAARHGLAIGMAGVLDDLGAPVRAEVAVRACAASRPCLRCHRPFASAWEGNRICDDCAPFMVDRPYEPL